jgi:hypothetical protein
MRGDCGLPVWGLRKGKPTGQIRALSPYTCMYDAYRLLVLRDVPQGCRLTVASLGADYREGEAHGDTLTLRATLSGGLGGHDWRLAPAVPGESASTGGETWRQ